jgi:hypothetical protein
MNRVARGASLGLYTGILLGLYVVYIVSSMEDSLYEVAELRYRQRQYPEAEPLYREIVQSRRARLEADHNDVIDPTASLGRLMADWAWAERPALGVPASAGNTLPLSTPPELSSSEPAKAGTPNLAYERAREAEHWLRECLAVRLSGTNTTHWRVGDVKSRLGCALVSVAVTDPELNTTAAREAKLAEAETPLVEGYQVLQREKSIDRQKYKRDALERLVRLYEAWGKPEKRSEWQQQLDAFDREKSNSVASLNESP